jgi:hypothetical protein
VCAAAQSNRNRIAAGNIQIAKEKKMSFAEKLAALAQLFGEAGRAHHRAFAATNGEDAEWSCWYARWLESRLEPILGFRYRPDKLSELLENAESARKSRSIADWPGFYAEFFLNRSVPQAGF